MIEQDNRFGFDCLLFEKCNLNCKFCLESHKNSNINLDWIHSLPSKLYERFKSENLHNIKCVSFRLWGGELFYDILPDSLFEEYKKLIKNIITEFHKDNEDLILDFSWVSNGIYKNTDRIIKLLKETNSKIGFSYDPIGRYQSEKQEELFFNNVKKFHDLGLINEISITLTKPNIYAYISNKSKIKDLDYCKKIDINYYIPNINWKELLPNDDDLFLFFKWCVDNSLFSVLDVSKIIKTVIYPNIKTEKICNCDRHISACKNCLTFNCVTSSTIFPNSDFYGDKEITEKNVAKIKKQLGLLKRGCMFCEYSNNCPQGCHTSILFKNYQISECPYKRLYQYIKNNKEILDNYRDWELINNNSKII